MDLFGKRIFIVEDNALNRVVYTMVLQINGAILQFDRFGRDTLSTMLGFKPDLIILDLMLPNGATGFDIYDDIRSMQAYKDVPIVAISASDPATAVPRCQVQGFDGFIAKPIEDDLLPDQLTRIMNGEKVWYLGERYGGEINTK